MGKRYSTTLNLNGSYHGISLELGAYVAKIQPGSVAAKEGSIAVGDRIVGVRIINNCVYRVLSSYSKLTCTPCTISVMVNCLVASFTSNKSWYDTYSMPYHINLSLVVILFCVAT